MLYVMWHLHKCDLQIDIRQPILRIAMLQRRKIKSEWAAKYLEYFMYELCFAFFMIIARDGVHSSETV